MSNEYLDDEELDEAFVWATENGEFWGSPKTTKKISPGIYTITHDYNRGVVFTLLDVKSEPLMRFVGHASDLVIREIRDFWERKELFRKFNILFKRGIFIYGPPGTGKTCALKILMNDVVEAGGIAVKWPRSADMFVAGMRLLRKLQPETPVVVVMEDLDAILENENRSKVLNILDGVESIDNVVYLATTNYPEKFEARIIDRPSRFDKRFEITYPDSDVRAAYIQQLLGDQSEAIDLDQWVASTKGFSIAHIKELFVSVVLLGNDLEGEVKRLRSMASSIEATEDRCQASDPDSDLDEDEDDDE